MKTFIEDHSTPWTEPAPPQAWPEQPERPQEEPASAAPDEPETQMLDEPGYGHGV